MEQEKNLKISDNYLLDIKYYLDGNQHIFFPFTPLKIKNFSILSDVYDTSIYKIPKYYSLV